MINPLNHYFTAKLRFCNKLSTVRGGKSATPALTLYLGYTSSVVVALSRANFTIFKTESMTGTNPVAAIDALRARKLRTRKSFIPLVWADIIDQNVVFISFLQIRHKIVIGTHERHFFEANHFFQEWFINHVLLKLNPRWPIIRGSIN